MGFNTEITLTGPYRRPVQMLAEQTYDDHTSIHDESTAASLGLSGAPIEAPTHFSQFDPLAVALWGHEWFEHGCISIHFRTMVVEGEEVQATLTTRPGAPLATANAAKADGTPVLTGTASIGKSRDDTELTKRLAALPADPGPLHIIDQVKVGMTEEGVVVSVDQDTMNGNGYPFSLAAKLDSITEPHAWYTPEGGGGSPWGRAVLPLEMISVLAHKAGGHWPVRSPALGLFLDMEIALLDGPAFVGQEYAMRKEIVGRSQSRRTESYWTRSTLTDISTGRETVEVLLHSGVFKDSYPGYPAGAY
jgi:hypothetical protein